MIALLLTALAFGADLTLEASVPTELHLDGRPAARLYGAGTFSVNTSAQPHQVTVFVNGQPQRQTVDLTHAAEAIIVVGRTGVSWPDELLAAPADAPEADVEGRVVFRSVADEDVVLQIAGARHTVAPGQELELVVGPGRHPMNVRNAAGTVVWVRGELHVSGDGSLVQLADGRMPEVMGDGGQFVASGG